MIRNNQFDKKISQSGNQGKSRGAFEKSIKNVVQKPKSSILEAMAIHLLNLINKTYIRPAFKSIHHHSSTLKNKQLIYAAISKANDQTKKSNQNEPLTARKKKKPDTFINSIKMQKEEEFFYNTDDLSTIILQNSSKQTIGKESRIDLEHLLEIGANNQNSSNLFWTQSSKISSNAKITSKEKRINQQISAKSNEPLSFVFNKRSRTDKSIDHTEAHESTFCQNTHFKTFKVKVTSIDKNNFNLDEDHTLKYSQITKITPKKTEKEKQKPIIYQIYILRESSQRKSRPSSYDCLNEDRKKYIQIPLKSTNVKVIECNIKNPLNRKHKSYSQSLNSRNCLQNCDSCSCSNSKSKEVCIYCIGLQKSQQIVRKMANPLAK